VARLILVLLAVYKRTLSPLLGARCRFEPSCADYARVAVARFGAARGGALGLWRLGRCHPLCRGGFDPVPDTFTFVRREARDERRES
jgi:putative membrane protein insertion efficiency factor